MRILNFPKLNLLFVTLGSFNHSRWLNWVAILQNAEVLSWSNVATVVESFDSSDSLARVLTQAVGRCKATSSNRVATYWLSGRAITHGSSLRKCSNLASAQIRFELIFQLISQLSSMFLKNFTLNEWEMLVTLLLFVISLLHFVDLVQNFLFIVEVEEFFLKSSSALLFVIFLLLNFIGNTIKELVVHCHLCLTVSLTGINIVAHLTEMLF